MKQEAFNLIDDFEEYSFWHRARKEIVVEVIKNQISNLSDKKLLDIGCGTGYILKDLATFVLYAQGLEEHIYGNKKYENILQANIFNSGLDYNSFDIVVAFDVLEHMENDDNFLMEMKKYLRNIDRNGGGEIAILS